MSGPVLPDSFPVRLLRSALAGVSIRDLADAEHLPLQSVRRRLCAAAAVALHRSPFEQERAELSRALRRFLTTRELHGCLRVAASLDRFARPVPRYLPGSRSAA
jgi:hypothetical protein